jgi:thiol:disulfide interchange protein DsbC
MTMRRTMMALLLAFSAGSALADEAQIRQAVESKLHVKVDGIQPGPLGLYEVRFRGREGVQVLYTDASATHLFIGNIFETANGRDITDERLRKLNAINFGSLPLDQAVKIQRGDGKRVLVMFSDPFCPACRQFEKVLQQVNDVTIYVFMFPVIRPELADASKAVWCSPDRAQAWVDVALRGKGPTAKPDCANPVQKNIELGRTLGVNSTPTLVFPNGERVAGGLRLADLTEFLDGKR